LLREQTRESVGHSDYEDISESTLLANTLMTKRSMELFDAVVRWTKRQRTQRELECNKENASSWGNLIVIGRLLKLFGIIYIVNVDSGCHHSQHPFFDNAENGRIFIVGNPHRKRMPG